MKYFHTKLWITTILCGVILIALVIKLVNNTYWELAIGSIITFLCGIIIYIQQIKYTEQIAELENRKNDYEKTKGLLNRIDTTLNIYRRFESLICMLDPTKDVRSIISEVVQLQENIDSILSEFRVHKMKINSHEELIRYERVLGVVINAYHMVFDGFKSEVVAKLNDLQGSAETALCAAEQIGTPTDKLNVVITLQQKHKYINERKEVFLNILRAQEANINKMRSAVSEAKDMLLNAEYDLLENNN